MAEDQAIKPKRWSAKRKLEVVLRLLKGELIDEVSREIGVESWRLDEWKQEALSSMELGLKERVNDPLSAELSRAKQQIGELSMKNEILLERIKKDGPLVSWRSK